MELKHTLSGKASTLTGKGQWMSNVRFREDHSGINHEAHLSTVKNAAPADSRVPRAHENARRARCHSCTPRQRACSPQRLTKTGASSRQIVPDRLTQAAQFEAVLANGRRSGTKCFLARALANSGNGPRLGLIVGKKSAPRAVDRNRVKRLARVAHRQLAMELDALDVVVQLRGNPRGRDNAALTSELRELLLGLLNSPGK